MFAVLDQHFTVNLQRRFADDAVNVRGGDIVTAEVVITSDGDMNCTENLFIGDDVALQARQRICAYAQFSDDARRVAMLGDGFLQKFRARARRRSICPDR